MNNANEAQQHFQVPSSQPAISQDEYLDWQSNVQVAADTILNRIIQANGGKIPYNCAANVIVECYRTLDIPENATIERGKFTGWTAASGLCEYPNHVWLRANSYTIVDPLAKRFRENHVPVEPMSYDVEKTLTLDEICQLDSFCQEFKA